MGLTALAGSLVSGVSQAATGSLVAAVWQGILLAVAVGVGLRLLPKTPAAARFAIWFAVFVVVVALPVVSLRSHAGAIGAVSGHGAWFTFDERWSLAIAAVWVLASSLRAGQLAVAAFRVRTLWKRSTPVEIPDSVVLDRTHRDVLIGARGRRRAEICVSDEVDRPSVIGFLSPKILIPRWLLEKLTSAELEQIVLHEAGHLGRADDWMNLLQKIALVVFPLNPALLWVERRLCFERELACDDRVLRATRAPKAYAACLASLAEHRMRMRRPVFALSIGALGRESELGRRVGRILRRGERMRPIHARMVLGGAMLGLLAGTVELARCPELVAFSGNGAQRLTASADQKSGIGTGMEYQAVKFSQPAMPRLNNDVRAIANAPHETLLKAVIPAKNLTATANADRMSMPVRFTESTPSKDPRMIQTKVAVTGRRSNYDAPRQQADVVQWVVVTEWQGEDGSRFVLTTARTSTAIANDAASNKQPSSQQVQEQVLPFHPYAAVPTRDGWLVIQL